MLRSRTLLQNVDVEIDRLNRLRISLSNVVNVKLRAPSQVHTEFGWHVIAVLGNAVDPLQMYVQDLAEVLVSAQAYGQIEQSRTYCAKLRGLS